jgi:prepilin-type N-terminal cleavage/methylation domain-containing protein
MKTLRTRFSGFTLIELLIVVAIIAILAAIAVPNFLEAQTRAKVSRAKADMRSLTTALETYVVDFNTYLYCNLPANGLRVKGRPNSRETFERLTTPIAYLSSVHAFTDPFKARGVYEQSWTTAQAYPAKDREAIQIYYYNARNNSAGGNARWDELIKKGEPKPLWYFIESSGPDGYRHNMASALNSDGIQDQDLPEAMYDSTNGTVSRGSMWRAGGVPGQHKDKIFYGLIQGQYH